MLPDAIRTTIYKALQARLSLLRYIVDEQHLPGFERDVADVESALQWLAEQEVEAADEYQATEYAGPIEHEGQRWPAFGTHKPSDR